jgi:hypothetical protein
MRPFQFDKRNHPKEDPVFQTFSEEFGGKVRLTTKSGSGENYFEAVAELPGDAKPERITAAWEGILKLQQDKLMRVKAK